MTGKALVVEDGLTDEGKPCFAMFATGYFPEHGLAQRAQKDQTPYDVWARDGWIKSTPGKVTKLAAIAKDLVDDSHAFDLQAVAYDTYLWERFASELDELGVELPVIEHPQGWSKRRDSPLWMPGSIDSFEQLILEGRLRVEPNPALRSAVMSARLEESPAGLRRFSKIKATSRIDLAVAGAQAVGAATTDLTPDVIEIRYEPGQMFLGGNE